MHKTVMLLLPMALLVSVPAMGKEHAEVLMRPVRSLFVDYVWSAAPVGFSMTLRGGRQYVAYYDSERRMTIACRELASEHWTYKRFDELVGWDSHNYVAFAFDREGCIHLSGNMHCVPLKYYRTTKPGDITTFERIDRMTGENEQRCTYPRFTTGPNGEFLFSYRDGGSGNGNEIVNVYDTAAKTWKRYITKPVFDGEGQRNAYYTGPARDSKGVYHYAWVWREDPDCSTNHDVSYIRGSAPGEGLTRSDGTPVELPITLAKGEIIDPIPMKGGLLNNVALSFDSRDRVMITYYKFDERGNTQVYTARLEESGWRIYQTTHWHDRWDFQGGGTIPMMISTDAPRVWGDGKLFQTFTNKYLAPYAQVRFLDERTLAQIGDPIRLYPPDFGTPSAKHTDDWQANIRGGSISEARRTGRTWALCWESAGPNRDRPREQVPPPSKLHVVEMAVEGS